MPDNVLPFDALIQKVEPGRLKRSQALTTRLTFLDVEEGKFSGFVDASKPENTPYEVRIDAKERTCRCSCEDFHWKAAPCKHLAAFSRICKTVTNGISV